MSADALLRVSLFLVVLTLISKPLGAALLLGTVLVIGGLTYVPALALGPIAEAMQVPERGGVPRGARRAIQHRNQVGRTMSYLGG